MRDKTKLQFSKRDDLNDRTKNELFDLIDSTDQKYLDDAYKSYRKMLTKENKS